MTFLSDNATKLKDFRDMMLKVAPTVNPTYYSILKCLKMAKQAPTCDKAREAAGHLTYTEFTELKQRFRELLKRQGHKLTPKLAIAMFNIELHGGHFDDSDQEGSEHLHLQLDPPMILSLHQAIEQLKYLWPNASLTPELRHWAEYLFDQQPRAEGKKLLSKAELLDRSTQLLLTINQQIIERLEATELVRPAQMPEMELSEPLNLDNPQVRNELMRRAWIQGSQPLGAIPPSYLNNFMGVAARYIYSHHFNVLDFTPEMAERLQAQNLEASNQAQQLQQKRMAQQHSHIPAPRPRPPIDG